MNGLVSAVLSLPSWGLGHQDVSREVGGFPVNSWESCIVLYFNSANLLSGSCSRLYVVLLKMYLS